MQEIVRNYMEAWKRGTAWQVPNLTDALDFMVTEAAEAVDARLRLNPRYARARIKEGSTIIDELADVVFMACVSAEVLGEDLEVALYEKLDLLTTRFHAEKPI